MRLRIEAIGVDSGLIELGLLADGTMEVSKLSFSPGSTMRQELSTGSP